MNKIILIFICNDKGRRVNHSKKDKVGGTDTIDWFEDLHQYWRRDRQICGQTDQQSTVESQRLMVQPAACSEWSGSHSEKTLEKTGTHRSNLTQNSPWTAEPEWQTTIAITRGRFGRRT